jgi:alpha-L-fucosidase
MTLDQLMEVYYRSVGRGAQLLLNIPADRRGHMPDADFARAREFGDEIRRRFGKSVAETSASGVRIELPISNAGALVDHVILQEDCRFGQRVRAFRLEGHAGGRWGEIYSGSSIGHKRIVPIAAQPFTALRLIVTESSGEPKLRRFAAFYTGAIAPATWDAPAQAGADDEVGRWQDGKFEIDLTSHIKDAAQYRVRFMPENGRVTGISQFQLLLGGVPAPHLVRRDPAAPNVLILTMTENGQKVVLSGAVVGAERGAILLEKI